MSSFKKPPVYHLALIICAPLILIMVVAAIGVGIGVLIFIGVFFDCIKTGNWEPLGFVIVCLLTGVGTVTLTLLLVRPMGKYRLSIEENQKEWEAKEAAKDDWEKSAQSHMITVNELPDDVPRDIYDAWYKMSSLVDGVRMGPRLPEKTE